MGTHASQIVAVQIGAETSPRRAPKGTTALQRTYARMIHHLVVLRLALTNKPHRKQCALIAAVAILAATPAVGQTTVQGGSQAPVAVTAGLVSGSNVVRLSAAASFMDNRGIVIYGAGTPCQIGGIPCSHVVIEPPAAAVNGYAGARGGPTRRYVMRVAACDANWGCTSASPPSAAAVAAPVLSEPHTAGASGNNIVWSVTPVAGAIRYVWWRSSDGGRTWRLWRITEESKFTDWQNLQTSSPNRGRWSDEPQSSVSNDDFVSSVKTGGGSTTLVLADEAPTTGSFTAWPDDTAEINAAYKSANAVGGEVVCSPGFYKVRSIAAVANVKFTGPFWDTQFRKGCMIYGTTGDDVFKLTDRGAPSPFAIEDVSVIGGRNAVFVPADAGQTPTYISIMRVATRDVENAAIGMFASVEELYVEQAYFTGGRYGIDLEGQAYLQKSAIRDSTFNGQAGNGLYASTHTVVFGYVTFDRDIFQVESQGAVYLNAPISYGSVLITGMTTEADGWDFRGSGSTASCSKGSDKYKASSVAGLAIGQDYTVKGCAASQMPVEGTICAIDGNAVTLMDPACRISVVAGRTAEGERSTSAIFDDLYTIGSVNLDTSSLGNAGRYSINAPAGISVRSTGFGGFGGLYDPYGASDLAGVNGEWLRPRLFDAFLTPGQSASTTVASGAYNAALRTTPRGGDFVVGLVDSAGNGTGAFGAWRVVKNDGNRSTLSMVDGDGNAMFRGGLAAASLRGRAVTVAELPKSPVEGMLVPVADSATNVWGAKITGGGKLHVLAYYDGHDWTVMAK